MVSANASQRRELLSFRLAESSTGWGRAQGARLWDTFQHHETALRFQQTATGKRQTTSDKHAQTAARRSFCICAAFLLFFPAFQRPAIANVLSKVCKLCRPLSCLVAPLFA
jgi:hypothetical protein